MNELLSKALQTRLDQLRDFYQRVASFSHSPEIVAEEIEDEIGQFRPIDPIQTIHVPEVPGIKISFPKKVSRRNPPLIKAASHDDGLFLLPYTQAFREAYVTRFGNLISPLKTLMERLRDLELSYHKAANESSTVAPEKGKVEKEENPLLRDVRFFRCLYTTIPDNTKLGRILTEIGTILSANPVENGKIVDLLSALKDRKITGPDLGEALVQYQKLAALCDNMFVSSIASWAALSTFVSIQAKALEKEMLRESGQEIYRDRFVAFKRFIKEIADGFSGSPTAMQEKALFYAYLSMQSFLSRKRHPKDFYRLNNFAQVGAGKTYTTPIFLKMFAELIGKAESERGRHVPKIITLYLTEANLCENVIKSMIEIGVPKEKLHHVRIKDLPSLAVKDGDCIVLSRHEVGLKKQEDITQSLEILVRRGFHFMIVADESSFMKNSESGISAAMETLYGYLKKRRILRVDYRLSATPVNNDTGDFLYLLSSNQINVGAFLLAYPDISRRMQSVLTSLQDRIHSRNSLTLHRLLNLLNTSGSRTGVLIDFNRIETSKNGSTKVNEVNEKPTAKAMHELIYTDCAGAVLGCYYHAVFHAGLFPIQPWLGESRDGKEIQATLVDIMQKLGVGYTRIVQPTEETIRPLIGLEKPLVHPGSRDLDALIPCLLLLKAMTSALTYDRALNAEEEVHFQINAKQLQPNLLEAVTNLEVLEKIRQFLNLIMFVNLVRKVRSYDRTWWVVREEVEAECRKLRMEFLATYAFMHGIPLIPKQEEVTRKVHKGFQIVEETESHAYLAARPDQKQALIGLLEDLSEGEILGNALIEELAQFFAPVRYFELLNLLEKRSQEHQRGRMEQDEEEIEKKRAMIMETLGVALGFKQGKQTFHDLVSLFKNDLDKIEMEEDQLIHFRPSILAKYPILLSTTLAVLQDSAKGLIGLEAQRFNEVLHDIGSEHVDLAQALAEYGIIFKASESLNFPLVLRFADRILHRLATLLAERDIKLKIEKGDVERIRLVISRCAGFENYARRMAELTRSHQVPLLISCRYRFSQQSLVSAADAEFSVTGKTEKSERYRLLESFDRLGENMGRTLVATTKSILKGFNLFYTQYGFMSEGMDNAEVRMQMAGRLRPLFPQHYKEIASMEAVLNRTRPDSPVLQHLSRLRENVKIFDIVSPQMISGFPDIQNGKAYMLNTFLFSQTHQRAFPGLFTDQEVFHFVDTRPVFNAKTVEGFCKKSIEEAIEQYANWLKGEKTISVSSFIELLEREIQNVSEINMRQSSYYDILAL